MKKALKVTIIILAVLLVVIVAASMLVKAYMTQERTQAFVSGAVEKALDRKVVVGPVDISLFRGIVVKDLEIREKDGEKVFLKTKEFVLAYQFLPLLAKRLVIDKLGIVDAEIYLNANPDGTYNFSDLAKLDKAEDQQAGKKKPVGIPIAMNVKDITIRNAKVGYTSTVGGLKKADVIINAELGITGLSKNLMSSEGSFQFLLAEALLKSGNRSFKDIKATARYKIDVDMASKQITLHSIDLDLMKTPCKIMGVFDYSSGMAYSIAVKASNFDTARISQDMGGAFIPNGISLGGNVAMFFDIEKKADKGGSPYFDGNIKMTGASLTYKDRTVALDGSLKLTPEVITFKDLKLTAGQDKADISGSVRNYREYPDLRVSIKSPFIALDELFVPVPVAASDEPQETARIDDAKKERERMSLKLKADVSLDIDKTRYKTISITNFSSRYELKDNVLSIPYLKGNILNGAFAIKGSVNLAEKGTSYNMASDLSGVRIEALIDAFAPKARGKLFGVLSGKASLTGSGTIPLNVKRNLKGKGEFTIQEGSLKNAELSDDLLAILGLQDLKEIPIEEANGNFTISTGTVALTTLIGSKDMTINETGTVGIDGKLDLSILVKVSERLAPKLVSQSSIASFLSGEKGWTGIPMKVGGTVSKPSYTVDTGAVGKKIKENLGKKIGEELQKMLLKDQGEAPVTEQKKSITPEGLIRGILGN